jgi:uncharacterized protein (TIGR00288 family)
MRVGPGEAVSRVAVFVDHENVAIGARDAGLSFDIELVLAHLHEKGHVTLKRAYGDWSRYATARRPMHERGFELVDVPHASYAGKNSADIRLVVDAIDLCHTRPHLDLFAIVSGDSDFSPLVSKLREAGRGVIGVGVKASTSRLLVECCDEFAFYDDLAREDQPDQRGAGDPGEALALVQKTARALLADRGEPVWASHVKQVLKRKRPQFREGWYGFRSFGELVERARDDGLVDVRKDDASGGYVVLASAAG